MATAYASVQQVIRIGAVDQASQVIDKAKNSLKGFENQAAKAGKAASDIDPSKSMHKIQETSGDVESALKGVSDFAGGASDQVSKLGDAFGATEAIMRLLPGPMGLAATAIVGAALGAKLLSDYMRESAAKVRLLGDSGTERLRKNLDLSADAAVKLSHALEDVREQGLHPSVDLLKQVRDQAEAMGADGAEAMSAFVLALGQGGEKLKEFERTYGRVQGLASNDTKLVEGLGLRADLLGLVKQQTAEERAQKDVQDAVARIRLQQVELARQEKALVHERSVAAEAGRSIDRAVHELNARAHADKAEALREQIESERVLLRLVEQEAEATRRAALERQAIASRADVAEARAAVASSRKEQLQLKDEAAGARRLAALKAINEFDGKHGKALSEELKIQRNTLEIDLLRAEAGKQAVRAERESDRQAARDKGRAAAEKAKAAAAKAAAETRKQFEEIRKTEEDHLSFMEQQARKSIDLAATVTSERLKTEQAASSAIAARLRARGQVEDAILTERAQAEADYSAAVIRIEQETQQAIADAKAVGEDARNIERAGEERTFQAFQVLFEKRKALASEEKQLFKDRLASATEALEGPAGILQNLGAIGPAFANAEGIGKSLSLASKGASEVIKNFGDITKMADAAGTALAGIGDAVLDAETKRTTAQLDNEKARELSTATTEEQRAAITKRYEDLKAKAVEDAERKKAGIRALVETAQAIAYAADGNFVGAAGHAAAAAVYAGVAGGAVGGPSAVGGSNTYAGGFNDPGTSSTPGSSGGSTGKGQTIIYQFNQPFVTSQQIGKALQQHQRSLASTGLPKAKGV